MKYFIVSEHNSIFEKVKPYLDIVDRINDCDVVLLWNDLFPLERSIIKTAKMLGKKTAVLQHGRRGSSRYFPPFNEPITADALLVWGERDKEMLIRAGHPAKKIKVIGSPILIDIPQKNKEPSGKTIVFCPEHWDRPVEENKRVRDELRKLPPEYNVITKIIESHTPSDFDNTIQSNREKYDHLDKCWEVLHCADLVVGISESTFELMAQVLDIPVVIVDEWEPKAFGGDLRYTQGYYRPISEAAKRTKVVNLLETIKGQLENPQELNKERAHIGLVEGGIHLDIIDGLRKLNI